MKKHYRTIFIVALLFCIAGCREFKTLSQNEFKTIWEKSTNNQSSRWLYMGEKNGYYYITQKWAQRKHAQYKISTEIIEITVPKKLEFSLNSNEWIYLKENEITFKKVSNPYNNYTEEKSWFISFTDNIKKYIAEIF